MASPGGRGYAKGSGSLLAERKVLVSGVWHKQTHNRTNIEYRYIEFGINLKIDQNFKNWSSDIGRIFIDKW